MPAAIPYSPTGLYWNPPGDIRCAQHAQDLSEVRWQAESWQPIPEQEHPVHCQYRCQKCSPDGNLIK
jgi:hypothetical protein